MDKSTALLKSSPSKKTCWGKEMALLKQRDLALLVKTKAVIKTIILRPVLMESGKVKYEIQVDIESEEGIEECLLITAKNEPQRWSSLNKAVEMLEDLTETCEFQIKSSKFIKEREWRVR